MNKPEQKMTVNNFSLSLSFVMRRLNVMVYHNISERIVVNADKNIWEIVCKNTIEISTEKLRNGNR